VALVVTGLTAGCTGSSSPEEEPASTADAVSDLDLTGVVVAREPFCDALDDGAVAELLGGEPTDSSRYEAGQRAELAPGLRDVADEHSCYVERGSAESLRTARAWLFAQPVTAREARGWVEERSATRDCREAGELSYGEPGLVQSCSSKDRIRVTAVGLFGDAWLTCQATAPRAGDPDELLEQTQQWCAEVARAASS
jgi:hypothetical protein